MIKVNLLRSIDTNKVRVPEETVSRTIQFKSGERSEVVQVLIRLGLIIIWPLLIFLYSWNIVSTKTSELSVVNTEMATLDADIETAKSTFKSLEGYLTDNENLNLLVGSIAGLSKRRKLAIENLDNLQKLTPPRVWFNEIKYNENAINIQGMAVNNDDFSDFLKALNETAFFQRVETVKNEEIKKKYGKVRAFEVICPLAGKI
ncbi:MAG: hypothetical protein A4S09_15445 [Proteobacteria bacterium SG_bin7]|nr:MAG: hypothetical protein A4S09_15445 [Proteobacteria bacterium SG_bin7]